MRKSILILFASLLLVSCNPPPAEPVQKPGVFVFGEAQQTVEEKINPLCHIVDIQDIEPIGIPTAKESQTQVDCDGFMYAGQARSVELIFADDMLDMVWILTEPEEEEFFVKEFSKLFGEPTHVRDEATIFLHHGVAIGNQPPEVLFLSERLEPEFAQWLEQNP